MTSMFSWCTNLSGINVSNFNTSNVEYMQYMFSGCMKLESLDLSEFDTMNVIIIIVRKTPIDFSRSWEVQDAYSILCLLFFNLYIFLFVKTCFHTYILYDILIFLFF